MNTNICKRQTFSLTILVAVLSLTFAGCLQSGKSGSDNDELLLSSDTSTGSTGGNTGTGGSTTGSSSGGSTGGPTPTPTLVPVTNVGMLNFEQINNTFSLLTNVPVTDGQIETRYEDVVGSLPSGNSLDGFNASVQSAVIKLAAEYCNEVVGSSARRGEVFPGVNFGDSPSNFSAAERANVVRLMIERFWQRPAGTPANQDDADLVALMNDLLQGEDNVSASTRAAIIGTCAAALGNANVLFL